MFLKVTQARSKLSATIKQDEKGVNSRQPCLALLREQFFDQNLVHAPPIQLQINDIYPLLALQ